MADNVTLNAGAGGDVIAADDIAGVKYQIVKLATGAADTANQVSNANPVPVSDAGGSLTVDGTVAVTGVATETTVAAIQDNTGELAATVKVEDAAHTTGDAGILTFAVRNDAGTALAGTTGDYIPLSTDSVGALRVAAHAVTTDVGKAEDAVAASGDTGVPVLAVRRDSASSGVSADGDYANLSVDSTGALRVTGGGGGTQYQEDAAHSSGDTGTLNLAVRRDADTTLVGTDGDYAPLQVNASGSLKVAITAGAGSGGTSIADGASFTRDTTSLTPVGGVVESSAPTLTAGDAVALSLTTGGAVRVNVASGGIAGVVEDAASAGGEEGVMVLAVRRDSASSGVSADGDFAALSVDSNGALRVSGAAGTTQYAEDAVAASGDSGVVVLAVRRDSASSGVSADGDYAALSVTSDGSLRVSGSAGTTQYTEDAASAGAESLCLVGAVRRDTAASSSGTDGDYSTLNTDATGNLRVTTNTQYAEDTASVGGESLTLAGAIRSDTANTTASTNGDYTPLLTDANGRLHVISAFASNQNVGTIGTSVTPGTSAAHLGKAEDAAHSSGDTGVFVLSVRQDTATQLAGTDGDYAPLITDASGKLHTSSSQAGTWTVQPGNTANTTAWLTSARPGTSGGLTTYHLVSAASANATVVKASAGQLFGWYIYNSNAAARKLVFHNASSTPTAGASVFFSVVIPPTSGANVFSDIGIVFSTGIAITTVTGLADSDSTSVAANDLIVNLFYA